MSGHSKWSQIKRQKGAADAKRAVVFTKLAHGITLAAKSGGGDPDMNFSLRLAIDRAKQANMPKNNIDRAIQRGMGALAGGELFDLTYEAFGPASIALVIEVLTDNKNRTAADMKHILAKHGGHMAGPGATMWMFDHKGEIAIASEDITAKNPEDLELQLIDAGAEDLKRDENGILVYTAADQLMAVKSRVEHLGIRVSDASLQLIPKSPTIISGTDRRKVEELLSDLENHEDVSNVSSSLN